MGKPGSGRYTDYVPSADVNSITTKGASVDGYNRRWKLFNTTAANEKGFIYGKDALPKNEDVIAAVSIMAAKLVPPNGLQKGDTKMFPTGVSMNFTDAPNTSLIKFATDDNGKTISIGNGPINKDARPAHAYMPNPLSPGATGDSSVNLEASAKDPQLGASGKITDPAYQATGPNTISPSETAANIASLGQDLAMGTSKPL